MARARLLDITRTLRRSDRLPTGIDRVERAYLSHFIEDDERPFGLARTRLGYLLLDREGLRRFHAQLLGRSDWPAPDGLARIGSGVTPVAQGAEASLRQLAIGRTVPMMLGRLLREALSGDFDYYNVGHSNLTDRVMKSVSDAGGRSHILLHDVIPLQHPDWQRPGTAEQMQKKVRCIASTRVV